MKATFCCNVIITSYVNLYFDTVYESFSNISYHSLPFLIISHHSLSFLTLSHPPLPFLNISHHSNYPKCQTSYVAILFHLPDVLQMLINIQRAFVFLFGNENNSYDTFGSFFHRRVFYLKCIAENPFNHLMNNHFFVNGFTLNKMLPKDGKQISYIVFCQVCVVRCAPEKSI